MNQFASAAIDRMSYDERCAIWLQTNEGEQWAADVEEKLEMGATGVDERPTYHDEDLVDYITRSAIDLAANWSNSRIRTYNESSARTD